MSPMHVPMICIQGKTIPMYLLSLLPDGASIEEIIGAIRKIQNPGVIAGFIEDGGVYYHTFAKPPITLDMGRSFVLTCRKKRSPAPVCSSEVLGLLLNPAQKFLDLTANRSVLIEKTEEAVPVCRGLQVLWNQERFVKARVGLGAVGEDMLPSLMRAYDMDLRGVEDDRWNDWPTHAETLMRERLGMKVATYQG